MRNFDDIKPFISGERLNPYLDYCKNNKHKALILYQMNLRLSAAFLPIISMLEVALRNAIDLRMSQNYKLHKEDNWIEQLRFDIQVAINAKVIRKSDFNYLVYNIENARRKIDNKIAKNIEHFLKRKYRNDQTFKQKSYKQQEALIKGKLNHIKYNEGIRIKQHVLITQMNFGFWRTFFEPEPYKFLKGDLINIFQNKESRLGSSNIRIQRKPIYEKLDSIRKFRNRIAHNEPIIFSGQKFDSNYPKQMQKSIMFILECLNQNLQLYSEDIYTINLHWVDLQELQKYTDT